MMVGTPAGVLFERDGMRGLAIGQESPRRQCVDQSPIERRLGPEVEVDQPIQVTDVAECS